MPRAIEPIPAMIPHGLNSSSMATQARLALPKALAGTFDCPVSIFPAERVIGPGSDVNLDIPAILGGQCVGFAALSLSGTVRMNINGGGWRTIPGAMTMTNCLIQTMRVQTSAGSAVTIQLIGV